MKQEKAKVALTILASLLPGVWGIFSIIFLFSVAAATEAATLHVPSDYETIQEAIDAASDGDIVEVADGIYTGDGNKNLDFLGKAITVRSENGLGKCIIDCEGNGRGFYFHNGEDENSVVAGFIIRNGYVDGEWPHDSGGSILCESSSPMIRDNLIRSNSALYSGGGIFCFESSNPTIQSNTVYENSAFLGGGIYCFRSSPVITDNVILSNSAGMHGGGISCSDYSYPTIQNNTVARNTGVGGAVECYHYASPTIINNVISRNSSGSGIFCFDSCFPTIINNTVVGNTGIRGGGVRGGGISCGRFASATVVNTILWNRGDEVRLEDFSSVTITYSDVQGGYEGVGNIDAAPSFVSFRNGDYRLRRNSPCIGAGTNDVEPFPSSDKDGNQRPNPPGSNCDIGAYENPLAESEGARLAPPKAIDMSSNEVKEKLASTWGKIKQKL